MNIRDAIIQAKKEGLCITRKSMPNSYFYPTNGVGRTIICRENGSFVVPGWEPQLNDLIATDWKISTVKPEKITDSQLERWSTDMIENLRKEVDRTSDTVKIYANNDEKPVEEVEINRNID